MGNSKNPSALAAMAGITNGDFAKHCLINGGAGMVTIGGYPIGREMVTASIKVAQRGRKEFILNLGEEADEIVREANKIPFFSRLVVNIRVSSTKEKRTFVPKPLQESMAAFEEQVIKEALEANHWNQSKAARDLRISERTIRYKIEKLDIRKQR